jgi:hypothetical protein
MESRGSLPCSQEPSTGPYLKPDRSSPYHPILSLLRSILILSTHLSLGLPSGLDNVGKREFLTIAVLELRPLGGRACSQSLYRLRYPGSYKYMDKLMIKQVGSGLIYRVMSTNKLENICLSVNSVQHLSVHLIWIDILNLVLLFYIFWHFTVLHYTYNFLDIRVFWSWSV